jgi:hypothetical protein
MNYLVFDFRPKKLWCRIQNLHQYDLATKQLNFDWKETIR